MKSASKFVKWIKGLSITDPDPEIAETRLLSKMSGMTSNLPMKSQVLSSSVSFDYNLEDSSCRRRPSSSSALTFHQPCFTFRTSTHPSSSEKSTRRLRISCDYSCFQIKDLTYRPPGTKTDLLRGVNLSLRENSLGLIFGRSGSGKTTLLQLIAGLCKPMSGSICVQKYGDDGCPCGTPEPLFSERVGIVFQFPERYFVAENVLDEITFGWPRQKSSQQLKELLALRLQKAFTSVGLNSIALDRNPHSLSGGYKRRLALAIQLVQAPVLLLLDEPLAGLDWKARADVVKLLMQLKKELTLLVVSHDLKELSPLVDESWRMEMGGTLVSEPLMNS